MELADYIKYCLGYIKLTRQKALSAQHKHSVVIPKEHFNILGLLNGDLDGSLAEPIGLPTFYSLDPKNVPDDRKANYEKEKQLANKVEEIYNAQRNDQFTKQIALSFGHFEVELPLFLDDDQADGEIEEAFTPQSSDSGGRLPFTANSPQPLEPTQAQAPTAKSKIERYPLFSLPILIEKKIEGGVGRYLVFAVDPEIQVNVAVLEPILGSNLYFQLIRELGEFERQGRLSLPFKDSETFIEIWQKVKAQLKLSDAVFDEQSFQLHELRIALATRANYFLAEDLQRLSQLDADQLKGTALTCWTEDSELNEETGIPEERELYFPFKYDKYQLRTLTILPNKAAIIQGPPGTGKSETISNLLCHLAATGKKVLFVSQKAQALKVVKDKLRSLGVNYLFGYLPNPGSAQLGEQDEEDGIAPQLTALKSHIESLGNKSYAKESTSTLEQVVQATHDCRQSLNRMIESQRQHWTHCQEAKTLHDFSVPISNWNRFAQHFTLERWGVLQSIKTTISKLEREIARLEAGGKTFHDLSGFESIDWTRADYSTFVHEIYQDVSETGYDGSSKLLRATVNSIRTIRLVRVRSKLPREFREFIDRTLTQDLSRGQAAAEIETFLFHTRHKQYCASLAKQQIDFRKLLASVGLTSEAYIPLESLTKHNTHDIEETKRRISRLHQVNVEMEANTCQPSNAKLASRSSYPHR